MCLCGRTRGHPTHLFLLCFVSVVLLHRGYRGVVLHKGRCGCGGYVGDTLEEFRIDWSFRRGLYESEGGVACQHLVLWNSRADFPCQ